MSYQFIIPEMKDNSNFTTTFKNVTAKVLEKLALTQIIPE